MTPPFHLIQTENALHRKMQDVLCTKTGNVLLARPPGGNKWTPPQKTAESIFKH